MLSHHATKMLQIRIYSPDYITFLLRIYAYLRDACASKFDDISMYRPMLQDLMDKANAGGAGKDKDNGTRNRDPSNTACSHCKSRALHEKLGIPLGYNVCPFKSIKVRPQARAAAAHLLAALEANPQVNRTEAIKAAKAAGEASSSTD
jgi:hypothetical protein